MPEVMQAYMRQSSLLNEPAEGMGNCTRVNGIAIGMSKYQIITSQCFAKQDFLRFLFSVMIA
jgi:hypothetical protein